MEKIISQYKIDFNKENKDLLNSMLFVNKGYNPNYYIATVDYYLAKNDNSSLAYKFSNYFNNYHIEFKSFKETKYEIFNFLINNKFIKNLDEFKSKFHHEFTLYYLNNTYIYNLNYLKSINNTKENSWYISANPNIFSSVYITHNSSLEQLKSNLYKNKEILDLSSSSQFDNFIKTDDDFINYLSSNYFNENSVFLLKNNHSMKFKTRKEALEYINNYKAVVYEFYENLNNKEKLKIKKQYSKIKKHK